MIYFHTIVSDTKQHDVLVCNIYMYWSQAIDFIVFTHGAYHVFSLFIFYFCVLIAVDTSAEKANELDRALIQLEHGVDIAMQVRK